jgi:hypothetical protein
MESMKPYESLFLPLLAIPRGEIFKDRHGSLTSDGWAFLIFGAILIVTGGVELMVGIIARRWMLSDGRSPLRMAIAAIITVLGGVFLVLIVLLRSRT